MVNDAIVAQRFHVGQQIEYRVGGDKIPCDALKRYRGEVIQAPRRTLRGVRVRIRYFNTDKNRTFVSWVNAVKLVGR